jgi:hypothetical protein
MRSVHPNGLRVDVAHGVRPSGNGYTDQDLLFNPVISFISCCDSSLAECFCRESSRSGAIGDEGDHHFPENATDAVKEESSCIYASISDIYSSTTAAFTDKGITIASC